MPLNPPSPFVVCAGPAGSGCVRFWDGQNLAQILVPVCGLRWLSWLRRVRDWDGPDVTETPVSAVVCAGLAGCGCVRDWDDPDLAETQVSVRGLRWFSWLRLRSGLRWPRSLKSLGRSFLELRSRQKTVESMENSRLFKLLRRFPLLAGRVILGASTSSTTFGLRPSSPISPPSASPTATQFLCGPEDVLDALVEDSLSAMIDVISSVFPSCAALNTMHCL
ncbi:hypothetical protein B0H11DRAFT_2291347 [Mycena galericulata]|nr:hypothetical protein B0H11DRAFT_2291347 [Mycena galericulata]